MLDSNRSPSLDGHSTPVSASALSPCGAFMATAASGGSVLLWDVQRGALLRRMAEPALPEEHSWAAQCNALAFSACGTWLAAAGAYGVCVVWLVESGALLQRCQLPAHFETARISSCVFTPCGAQLLLVLEGHFAALWQRETGTLVRFPHLLGGSEDDDSATCGALSACGTQALLGYSSGSLRVFDLKAQPVLARELLREYGSAGGVQHCGFLPGGVLANDFSPNSVWFAAHSGGELALWSGQDTCTSVQARSMEPGEGLRCAALAPDGSSVLMRGEFGNGLCVIDSQSGQQRLLHLDVLGMSSAAWFGSAANSVFCAASDGAITRFALDANGGDKPAVLEMRYARQVDAPATLAWVNSEHGALLFCLACDVAGTARCIWRWDAAGSASPQAELLNHERLGLEMSHATVTLASAHCTDLAEHPNGLNVLALGCSTGEVALLDACSLALIWRAKVLPSAVGSLQFSADGSLLVASAYGCAVRVLRTRDAQACLGETLGEAEHSVRPTDALDTGHYKAALSPDNQQLLVAEPDNTVRQLQRALNQTTGVFSYGDDSVCALAFSPDGALALVARWNTCAVLYHAQHRTALACIWQPCAVTSACFLPDGTVVTGAIDGRLRFWRLADLADPASSSSAEPPAAHLLCSLRLHTDSITQLVCGLLLAPASRGALLACASQDGSLSIAKFHASETPHAELLWRGATFGQAALLLHE